MRSDGISKKITWPAVGLVAVGALVVILGALLDEEVLIYIGAGIAAGTGIQLPVGYSAPPTPNVELPSSDDLLSHEARANLAAEPQNLPR